MCTHNNVLNVYECGFLILVSTHNIFHIRFLPLETKGNATEIITVIGVVNLAASSDDCLELTTYYYSE